MQRIEIIGNLAKDAVREAELRDPGAEELRGTVPGPVLHDDRAAGGGIGGEELREAFRGLGGRAPVDHDAADLFGRDGRFFHARKIT